MEVAAATRTRKPPRWVAGLAPLVERARRLCWVSNTLATPPAIEYRSMEVP